MIGILINASGWESFATPMTIAGSTTEGASIKVREIYSLPGANTEGTIVDFCPNIKLGVVYEALVSTPTSIEIGPRPNNCWIEPYQAFLFNEGIPVSITASTCDNNYFALSGFEFPRPCSLFETISYDLSTGVGEGSQTGNLTFNYGNNKTLEIPISAIAYNPSTPDVWEVAREIETFPYSETITSEMPVWDNYRLPGKIADGKDAVFKLDFESDVVLSAFISDGENGKVALYREGFEGQGGPSTDNYFNGLATDITDCQCDFEGGDLGNLDWVFEAPNSNEYWTVTTNNPHSGTYCMKSNSGCWSGNSSNCISFTRYVPHDITMSFWARISSETNCDKGYFFIDGVAKIDGISGNGDWIFYSYDVPQGLHTFKWEYRKDDDWCRNDDCFYVDDLFLWDAYTISLNCGLPVPQGSYYLIASSTSDQFTVNIEKIEIPFPIAATSPSPSDHFNCYDDNYSSLNWQLGGYTKEYQVLFGETNPPTTVLVDWTEELAESCTIDGLGDNKTYFWRVNERNSSGTTEGAVWTFTTFKDINASADNIIFVSPTGAGVKDGSSWVNAASSIQAAIDAAAAITENQPVVWVSKGNYYANGVYQTLNNKTCCFYSHDGVRLYGGFNGDETADYDLSLRDFENNATILDAESQCYVIGTRSGTWDGFVMQHGGEGGFYSYGETSTVQNCKILYSNGNGVQVGGGNLNCFHNEISYHSNVGIRKGYLTSALELKDCVISHNTQYGVWGTCKVERCYVCNNGNGVSSDSSRGGVLINSVVANNDGFGTDFTYVFNSTIVNNGTGIARCYYYMNLYLYNNIIWGNERQWDSNWSWSSFYSINLINNAIQGGAGDKGGVYPNITLAGRGEVGFSPDFVNPTSGIGSGYEGGDWSLLPTSPCVNFGYENIASFPNQGSFFNNYMPFSQLQDYMVFDIVGNPRTQNGRIDIGAIESSYDKPEIILPVRPDANNIIYVKADGDGDGSSWANAANLWDAIETSCLYESVPAIWVAQGTYIAPNLTFQIKGNMRLYGGFEGTEPANYDLTQRDYTNHPSVLDGNNTVRVLGQSHTLGIATAAVIDGFTLQNGLADNGAGAYLLENSTFSNCTVINNRTNDNSEGKGGGVYADGAFVENCSVKHNTGNIGGGMYLNKATVRDCFVENNTANQGGGIYANNSRIIQSQIGNNTAAEQAGGFYAIASDLLQCNIVSNANGGLLVCADDNGSYANLYNSILWGNSGSNLVYHSGMAQNNTTVSHCAIEGWSELSHGNIPLSADNEGDFGPHFTEDWQLGEASICINAGNSTLPNEGMPLYDLNNNPRVQNDLVDIGAFESPYPALCREMEMLEVSIREGETYDFYGTLLSQPGTYEHSWMEDDCLHLVMLQLRTTLIYYVSETGNGNMDGSSWENALDGNTLLSDGYTKLASYIATASPYTEFWLTSGHYYPCGDQDAQKYITMNEGVRLFGGFAGNENAIADRNPENDPTVFSGELQNDNITDNNTECIFITSLDNEVFWTIPAVLDGITISNGYASSHKGAALRISPNTFASLNNCSIVENNEGGIYNLGVLNISNSDLSNNDSELFGEYYQHAVSHIYYYNAGAICNMETGVANVDNCTFYSNHSPHNGAICNDGAMSINASVFDNNTADCFGTIFSPGKIKVHNTTFNNNRSDHYIAVMWAWDSLELVNCNITNNKSNYYTSTHFPSGGAANFSSRRTSGIEAGGYSQIVNCSFINNDAGTCPGGALSITGTANVENCIFRENSGQRPWRDPETGGNIGAVVWIGDPDGGALFVSGTARVSDCEFSDNTAFKGNTIGVFGGSLIMDRCKVVNNIAVSGIGYGAIDAYGRGTELTINNSLIANSSNGAIIQGGGIHSHLNNTTIVNTAGGAAFWFEYVQDSSIIEMNNCIVSGYSNLQSYQMGNEGTLVMNNTLMNQPVSGGDNDPMFVNPTTYMGYDENVDPLIYDWTLQPGSPCINTGDVSLIDLDPLAVDLAGEPRVKDGQIDMGAYEYGEDYVEIAATPYPSDGGTVTGAGVYNLGSTAVLTAAADAGYVFANWTKDGTVVSTSQTLSFEVTEPASYTANFISFFFDVIVDVNLEAGGSVTGTGSYYYGETATLTATPNEGYSFVSWTEDGTEVSAENTLSFVVTGDRLLTANFAINTFTIIANADPIEGGAVTGAGVYDYGETVTLTAAAAVGYLFVNWTEGEEEVSSDATLSFTATEDRELTAHFVIDMNAHAIEFVAGWNWWSANQEITLEQLESAVENYTSSIVAQNSSDDYMEGYGWDNSGFETLDLSKMYKMNFAEATEVTLSAPFADPSEHTITIKKGNNWIGYPVQQTMSVDNALANLTKTIGDRIKSNRGYTTWLGSSWSGTLKNLEPGHGYVYIAKGSTQQEFTYPSASKGVESECEALITTWTVQRARFASTMDLFATVEINGMEQTSDELEIGAFVGDDCRGAVKLMYVKELGKHIAFLTVSGNNGETVSFKALRDGNVIALEETVTIQIDKLLGDAKDPFVLHAGSEAITLYPNPVEKGGEVRIDLPATMADATVEVVDMTGRIIAAQTNLGRDAKSCVSTAGMTPGVYTVRVISGNSVATRKLVVR